MAQDTLDLSTNQLHPDLIEYAYRRGFFPMPHPETGEILWFDPEPRAVFPLGSFIVSRATRRSLNTRGYALSLDQNFAGVVDQCALRKETWITDDFKAMYQAMFARKQAHSVEVWHGDKLIGGVFGLHFGAVFHGESMFSHMTDASKIGLWALSETLVNGGFEIFEVQFLTDHLASLGAIGLKRAEYHDRLVKSASLKAKLDPIEFDRVMKTETWSKYQKVKSV